LKYYSKQHGAALIVALMVVALVAMLAITLGNDFMVATKRVQHQVFSQQAFTYLLGADGFARKWLLDDINGEDDNNSDSEFDIWNAELDIPTDQGLLSGQLSDLQGRFNLNNLLSAGPSTGDKKYGEDQKRFIRLLQTLELEQELDEAAAEELSNALVDWIDDNDVESSPGGAESGYYSDNKPYGRVANRAMVRVSELRMVKGFSAELVKALSPHVRVWPEGGGDININTASLNVLRSLNAEKELQPLNKADAQYIIEQRESDEGLEDLSVFEKGSLRELNIVIDGLGNTSDYFLLSTETLFLDQWFRLYSIIYRNTEEKTIKVIARNKINSF
jgi:general secretion pathway protein K